MATEDFYDTLAPVYHLIYADWEASLGRQGKALDGILRAAGPPTLRTVLDAACGVGTQSLGLAMLGYEVTASDLSPAAVERARREAAVRGLSIATAVADMRNLRDHHAGLFDVVIACDNAVPHLLSDADILTAFRQFHACTAPGGLCLISVRDYEGLDWSGRFQIHPYGAREQDGVRYVLVQLWELALPLYDITFYVIEHRAGEEPVVRAPRATYYAVPIPTLMRLLEQAGFAEVRRIDGELFQPVLLGRKPREGA